MSHLPKIAKRATRGLDVHHHFCLRFCGGVFMALAWLTFSAAQAQTTYFVLGTTALLEEPAAGTDSVVLAVTPPTGSWTATTNATWLHLSPANQSGSGSMNVIFSYDANPGATRSSTLTIAGQTLTVAQAGSTYVEAESVAPVLFSRLSQPEGVAVDGAGNVYATDFANNALYKWTASNSAVTTLVSSGLNQPDGVAVDGAGNVYVADYGDNTIQEWIAASNTVTTLVASGLNNPTAVAVDGAGNVYIADGNNNAIKEWNAANSNVVTLVSSGLSFPAGVAVDATGNVYIADYQNNAVKEWSAASNTVTTLASSGLNNPVGVAVDGAGNVYIGDSQNDAVKKWTPASNTMTILSAGLGVPFGVAVDARGNVYVADIGNNGVKELPYVFVDPTPKLESLNAGNDVLPVVLPVTGNLLAPFTPASSEPWLTIVGASNGIVSFSFAATSTNRTGYISLLGQEISITQGGPTYSLGTAGLLEGPSAGTDSVVLAAAPPSAAWTATTNAPWLHLSPASQSGSGSMNVVFEYDANPGAMRSGTLTVGGQTLTVTQAGSTYVAAESVAPALFSGLSQPDGVAVDGAGNVYATGFANNVVYKWTASNSTATALVSSGLDQPDGVAVDGAGNIYVADYGDNTIQEWIAASNTVTSLVASGLNTPTAVAVDGAGNVYVADGNNNAIKEWLAASKTVLTLVSTGLSFPAGVAVDAAGNVYIADYQNNAVKEWSAASNTVTTLVSSGLHNPVGVAVDGAGNVYIGDSQNNALKKWTAADQTVTTLPTTLEPVRASTPSAVAVDGAGNVYFGDPGNLAVKELPHAFVDPTPKLEGLAAGNDALPVVAPATAKLLGPFTPISDQRWLTITGTSNGVVSFAFTATTSNRTANINLLGRSIPVTQGGPSYSLGTTVLLEGAGAGSNTVVLGVTPQVATWTNSTHASWLHLSPANQSGVGSTNVVFSYDANPGATRSGTLTVGGQTLTVTQAGSTYVPARPVTALVSSGLLNPYAVAVDGTGNVYIADSGNGAIKKWTVTNNIVTTLVVPPVSPVAVAVDSTGNVYMATELGSIQEWTVANSNLTTLPVEGLDRPQGVAVDSAGNVYIANTSASAIDEWAVADSNLTTLVSSGLLGPHAVAVDRAGNVYFPDWLNHAVKEWAAANGTTNTLVSSGLANSYGVAVDGAGNVYIADVGFGHGAGAILELPYAFVDPTPKLEALAAGSDALPAVLPTTANLLAPFAPTSDQSWLTIAGVINGVVSFSFTANAGPARTAHILLLGQSIPIVQGVIGSPPLLTGAQLSGNGVLQFAFSNNPSGSFTVLSTTNLALPLSDWTVAGTATNTGGGQFQFTSQPTTNEAQLFYVVRSP